MVRDAYHPVWVASAFTCADSPSRVERGKHEPRWGVRDTSSLLITLTRGPAPSVPIPKDSPSFSLP